MPLSTLSTRVKCYALALATDAYSVGSKNELKVWSNTLLKFGGRLSSLNARATWPMPLDSYQGCTIWM